MTANDFLILVLAFLIALSAMLLLMLAIGIDWLVSGEEIRGEK